MPFAAGDVPALIDDLASTLAVYYVKRSKFPGPGPMAEQIKADFYDKVLEDLEKIKKGEIRLPELTSKVPRDIKSSQSGYTPIFDVDDISNAAIDSDRLDDISDSRE